MKKYLPKSHANPLNSIIICTDRQTHVNIKHTSHTNGLLFDSNRENKKSYDILLVWFSLVHPPHWSNPLNCAIGFVQNAFSAKLFKLNVVEK